MKTNDGKKIVTVPGYTKTGPGGQKIRVDPHKRSTPDLCRPPKKGGK